MSAAIAVRVSPKGAALPGFSGVPITHGRMGRADRESQEILGQNFELLMATVERRPQRCEQREPLRLVS
jgi:hypothetical protein